MAHEYSLQWAELDHLLTRGPTMWMNSKSSYCFADAFHTLCPSPPGVEFRLCICSFDSSLHGTKDLVAKYEKVSARPEPPPGTLVVWFHLFCPYGTLCNPVVADTCAGHYATAIWQTINRMIVAPVFLYDSLKMIARGTLPLVESGDYPSHANALWEVTRSDSAVLPKLLRGITSHQGGRSTCWLHCGLIVKAFATHIVHLFWTVAAHSLAYPPEIFVTEGEVDAMRDTWAPFFFVTSLGGMGSGPIFGNHRPPKSEWFKGLINGLPEGIFPPFGFSFWAAQRIAVALDLVKVPLRSPRVDKDAKQQFRHMWVVPKRSAGKAAISALKYAPATAKAWDETAWKAAVDSVVLIFCDGGKHYVKHIGLRRRDKLQAKVWWHPPKRRTRKANQSFPRHAVPASTSIASPSSAQRRQPNW
eukprot:jgi/Tetstr1/445528/TSEL_033304.t1